MIAWRCCQRLLRDDHRCESPGSGAIAVPRAAARQFGDAIEKIKASGKTEMHVLTDAEKKAWIGKLMPVHTEMQGRFGKDFIEQIYKASGFTPPQS